METRSCFKVFIIVPSIFEQRKREEFQYRKVANNREPLVLKETTLPKVQMILISSLNQLLKALQLTATLITNVR